jgi:predicted transcriptional regulator
MPDDRDNDEDGISISSEASALVTSGNQSLAEVLAEWNMEVRDFIILSFVADQGPIASRNLARMIGIDLQMANQSVALLASAGFIEADGTLDRLRVTKTGERLAQEMLQQI